MLRDFSSLVHDLTYLAKSKVCQLEVAIVKYHNIFGLEVSVSEIHEVQVFQCHHGLTGVKSADITVE